MGVVTGLAPAAGSTPAAYPQMRVVLAALYRTLGLAGSGGAHMAVKAVAFVLSMLA